MTSTQPLGATSFAAQAPTGATKELRLAVICYGGVSLAIYMHGQTKEIHHLVQASRSLDAGDVLASAVPFARPADEDGGARFATTRDVYAALLAAMAGENPEGVRTRVVVDIVSGTSAGGINGVYLAKAIAQNRSQRALRNLWMDKGDLGQLLRGPTFIPWQLRLPFVVARLIRRPALRGDRMAVWLYRALADMDAQERRPGEPDTLLADDHRLRLFVTATDFHGYRRDIILIDPEPDSGRVPVEIVDWRHSHVLEFRRGGGRDDFGAADNAGLALAARATSSFPGAFRPVSFAALRRYLRKEKGILPPDMASRFFPHYRLAGWDAEEGHFVDGGVLDNKPFATAIKAIAEAHTRTEVDRRVIYLEPDPNAPGPGRPRPEPSVFATVIGALSGIPRKEPLIEDLLDLTRHNDRVRRLRDVVEMSFERIATQVEGEIGPLADVSRSLEAATVARWSDSIHQSAQRDAGFGYATYIRAKIGHVIDRFAKAICDACGYPTDCTQSFFVRTVMRAWGRRHGLFEQKGAPTPQQNAFLRQFDLEFAKRRLAFTVAGLDWLYRDRAQKKPGCPPRRDMDAVKACLDAAIARLDDAVLDAYRADAVRTGVESCFGFAALKAFSGSHGFDPRNFAARNDPALIALRDELARFLTGSLRNFTADLFAEINALTCNWPPERRRDLLARYLGFAYWDILLFPLQAIAGGGERDHVEVRRMSPRDATLLGREGETKLDGVRTFHFGAFFRRRYRENDYLWGRLDGAECLIELLLGRDHPGFEHWCADAFAAILAEEREASPPLNAKLLADRERSVREMHPASGRDAAVPVHV